MSEHITTADTALAAEQAPMWRPTAEGATRMLLFIGYAVAVIGAVALALSFLSIDRAARPYFGAASWAIPVLMDSTIGVLIAFSLIAELNRLRAPLARTAGRALVALTVYANVAPQHSLYGKILHGAPPVIWVVVVAVAETLIRRLARLGDKREIEQVRRSLWLLRPVATWRLWRAMRVHQITTYAAALDRDAARAAVVGRLRLHHGRMWRGKAPLGDRIALRLQGRDPSGVAAILGDHADTAALLAAPVVGRHAEQVTAEALPMPLDPIVYQRSERPALPFTALAIPFTGNANALTDGHDDTADDDTAEAETDEQQARRLRAEGNSFAVIAARLGRSKTWAYNVAGPAADVEQVNGRAA